MDDLREYAMMVRRTRKAQRDFFVNKSKGNMERAKGFELELDRMTDLILPPNITRSLFESPDE